MSEECQIKTWGSCCCTCRHHVTDYYHCTIHTTLRNHTKGCVCSIPKGYICLAPELGQAFSEWPEHGMCEMHQPKPDVLQPSDNEVKLNEQKQGFYGVASQPRGGK